MEKKTVKPQIDLIFSIIHEIETKEIDILYGRRKLQTLLEDLRDYSYNDGYKAGFASGVKNYDRVPSTAVIR